MKKNHTKYGTNLLIGLFIFHSFSGCIQSAQPLGVKTGAKYNLTNQEISPLSPSYQDEPSVISVERDVEEQKDSLLSSNCNDRQDSSKASENSTWKQKIYTVLVAGVVMTTLVLVPVGIGIYNYGLLTSGTPQAFDKSTVLNRPFSPKPFLRLDTMPLIEPLTFSNGSGLLAQENFGNLELATEEILPHEGLINDGTDQGRASTDSEQFKGMYVGEILSNILSKDFDSDKLQTWFNEGLDPNMEDSRGRTLLMQLVMSSSDKNNFKLLPLVKIFLKEASINLYKKDHNGFNVLDYVKGNTPLKTLLKRHMHRAKNKAKN